MFRWLSKCDVLKSVDLLNALKSAQQYLLITEIDKSPNTAFFCCKHVAQYVLFQRLPTAADFQFLPDAHPSKLISRFRAEIGAVCAAVGTSDVPDKLPAMRMTVKVHKKPVNFRFITNGRDTFTSGTCIWLHPILALLITDICSIAADRARA